MNNDYCSIKMKNPQLLLDICIDKILLEQIDTNPLPPLMKNNLSYEANIVNFERIGSEAIRRLISGENDNYDIVSQFVKSKEDKPVDFNWYRICIDNELPEQFIRTFSQYLFWGILSSRILSIDILAEFPTLVHWNIMTLLYCQLHKEEEMLEPMARRLASHVFWSEISEVYFNLSSKFRQDFAHRFHWGYIQRSERLTDEIIINNAEHIAWKYFPYKKYKLSDNLLSKMASRINWTEYFYKECKLSVAQLEEFCKYFDNEAWELACWICSLREDFLRRHANQVYWKTVMDRYVISEELAEEVKDKICWKTLCTKTWLTKEFLERNTDRLHWTALWEHQRLPESFIRANIKNVKWDIISRYQKLSERFMHEHRDSLCWTYLCQYQRMSEKFIREHSERVDWPYIFQCQKTSYEFKKEFGFDPTRINYVVHDRLSLFINLHPHY